MPVSKFYNPLIKPKGEVSVPGPNDPVQLSRQGNTTMMDFGGAEPARVGGSDLMQGLRDLFMGKEDLPEAPESADAAMGYEPLEMPYGQDYQIPSFEPAKPKPTGTYVTNRGGTGDAGRESSTPQLGGSQFDVGPQFMEPEDEMSIADLRKLDDKPWELDQNTAVDVAPGTSLTPQTESEASEKLDLDTPQGLYKALSQRYPDILTRNLDELEGARVTAADTDALRERGNLGSLFIAASKAASGAGSVRGKTAESIAEKIVSREDTLARQQLKDRLDVARENMALNAKAVDLATQQINFADEREQYDPNSDVSQFARDFMQQEFGVKVPSNVPAYQLKQFLPAILSKYQAQERAKYQSAALGQRNIEAQLDDAYRLLKLAQDADDKEAERNLRKEIARLSSEAKAKQQAEKPEKFLPGTNIPKEVADRETRLFDKFNQEPSVKKFKSGNVALKEMENLAAQNSPYGDQGLISGYAKILDPESVVREGEYAVVERGGGFFDNIRNRIDILQGRARLQPAQRAALLRAAQSIQSGRQAEYQRIRSAYEKRATQYGLDPQRTFGLEDEIIAAPQPATQTAPSGTRSVQEIEADIEAVKEQIRQRGGK
jgi:hypothetical protein